MYNCFESEKLYVLLKTIVVHIFIAWKYKCLSEK